MPTPSAGGAGGGGGGGDELVLDFSDCVWGGAQSAAPTPAVPAADPKEVRKVSWIPGRRWRQVQGGWSSRQSMVRGARGWVGGRC